MDKLFQESLLDNKLRVISYNDTNSSMVAGALVVRAGSRYENENQLGYAHILEHMLLKGTPKRPTSFEMGLEIDKLGAFSNALTNKETVSLVFEVDAKYKELLVELTADRLLNSLIKEETLENEKKVIISELKNRDNDLQRSFMASAVSSFFQGHPLANDVLGNEASVASSNRDAVLNYYGDFFKPERSALIFVGRISHEEAISLAQKYFSEWQAGVHATDLKTNFNLTSKKFFRKEKSKQTRLNILYPAFGAASKEDFLRETMVLDMLANFLSYGYSSVLIDELRSKSGLIYGVSSANVRFSDAGYFSISTSTPQPSEVLLKIKKIMSGLKGLIDKEVVEKLKVQASAILNRKLAYPGNMLGFLIANFVYTDQLIPPETIHQVIKAVEYDDFIDVLDKYFIGKTPFLAVAGPRDIEF